ncbi:MAG: cell wall-binding repeat-containing protein [Actinobacteria bacterium]|nr:cell wall-binding repeat-containing protein [Actinomycetota bacterium]
MRAHRRSFLTIVGMLVAQLVVAGAPVAGAESSVERLAGGNRFATAVAVSQAQYPEGAPLTFIATGANYADALSISAAASGLGPVLLVERDRLPSETADELERLSPFGIVVVGGTAAISDQTMIAVARYAGRETRRIAGSNRFATAAEISQAAFETGSDVVFVASGHDFRDALAAAPAAAAFTAPMLLTAPTALPDATEEELRRLTPQRIVVVGSTDDVSDGVVARLRDLAPEVLRIGDPDDEVTSAEVSRATFTSSGIAFVATSVAFADGLTGGAFAGAIPAPLLLVSQDEVSEAVKCELVRLGVRNIVVLGGPAAVSERVAAELEAGYEAEDVPGCQAA